MRTYGSYGYYGTNSAGAGALAGAVLAMLGIVIIICIVIAVLQIIGVWKTLNKGGKPGWGALIPIYNEYLLCTMVGVNPWWILIVLLSPLLSIIPIIGSLVSIAISIYFMILLNVSIARSFGKDDAFAIGLILLSPIFYLILGAGSAEFVGAKPMNDVVFEKINANKNSSSTQKDFSSNDENAKFCSKCGSKVDGDTKFCPSCGNNLEG